MMVTTQVCDGHDHVELFFSFSLFLASDIAKCRSYPLEIVMLCSTDLVHAFLFCFLDLFFSIVTVKKEVSPNSVTKQARRDSFWI